MLCTMGSAAGSDAATGFAASGDDALGKPVAVSGVAFCAAWLLETVGDEDTDAESSAPHPLNENDAMAIEAALIRRNSFLMSASSFVKADAVSISFKK